MRIIIGQALPDQFEKPKGQTTSAKLENENQQALPAILSWTHYERLMRIKEKEIRDWYMREANEIKKQKEIYLESNPYQS